MLDVIDAGEGRAYHKAISQLMMDKGLDNPVRHTYEARYMWMEGNLFGPLCGFNKPFGGANGPVPGNAANGA
ncbi:hypothetical protein NL676_029567 [Syzygium grande]|nr:hypothetical protein NL676_029567 [Syzygium grande]